MVQLLSLPFIITSSLSVFLAGFFLLLYKLLNTRHKEPVHSYFIFSMSALITGIFLAAFAVLINSGENLEYLNIANRVTIITSMFTVLLSMHFYIFFFDYPAKKSLKWCYAINTFFSLLCIFPNQYFLMKEFYPTSQYYTGLVYGPLFQLWGAWLLLLSLYCLGTLIQIYRIRQKDQKKQSLNTIKLLLITGSIWMITGLGDALTGIQLIDLPPSAWIGALLVTCSISWILILHIDNLYKDRSQLSNQLMHDHLTQALSRSYFEIRLSTAITEMGQGICNGFYVCLLDIDDFKKVNDTYGHACGDQLLKGISDIVKETIRPGDSFARLGGDEFVLLLCDLQEDSEAITIVESIRSNIAAAYFGNTSNQFTASCSFGMVKSKATYLKINDLANQLLTCADKALYSSKSHGKNTISITSLT